MKNSIHERALLVGLHVGTWSGRKHDKKVTEEVMVQHQADVDAGNYNKKLISRSALKDISKSHTTARQRHYTLTLPWDDDGKRILASKTHLEYTKEMQKCKHMFYHAVEEFCSSYPEHIKEAEDRLGSMFDKDEFPTVDEIREKFSFDVEVLPLPKGDDLRIDITEKEIKAITNDIKRRTDERINNAVRSIYERVENVISKMVEGLEAYKPKGGDIERRFRDSLVFNVHEMAKLLPALNITGDPDIEKLQKRITKELCQYGPEELRYYDDKRLQTAKKAKNILEKVSQYMA